MVSQKTLDIIRKKVLEDKFDEIGTTVRSYLGESFPEPAFENIVQQLYRWKANQIKHEDVDIEEILKELNERKSLGGKNIIMDIAIEKDLPPMYFIFIF